jgi:hypothetical protein
MLPLSLSLSLSLSETTSTRTNDHDEPKEMPVGRRSAGRGEVLYHALENM